VRWLILALLAVCLSTGAALSVSLVVVSESALSERKESAARAQYRDEDYGRYVESPQDATPTPLEVQNPETNSYFRWLAKQSDAAEDSQAGRSGSVSEGTISGASAPAEDLSIMEPSASYSRVVDNASAGWFLARGWQKSSGSKAQLYGKDFSYIEPSEVGAPALFRVNIPATDYYTVYARWPTLRGNNARTRFGVSTVSGIEWIKVDQRRDGGMWVRLGAYEMVEGNRNAVQVSGYKATGRVVADAVMVVRGTQMEPPEVEVAAGGQARGEDVIRLARSHIGTPYVHSPPGTCEAHRSEDCSCLTSLIFSKVGITVPDHPVGQWGYGRYVAKSDLSPGDLVFFKEAGSGYPITHVGIYSGNGNMIHASSYWGGVVERPIESVSGYYGARRLGQYK
jgi:cell wall-associated NlpC family hydrolase